MSFSEPSERTQRVKKHSFCHKIQGLSQSSFVFLPILKYQIDSYMISVCFSYFKLWISCSRVLQALAANNVDEGEIVEVARSKTQLTIF